MTRPARLLRSLPILLPCIAAALAAAGCASRSPVEWRLQVRTSTDWSDLGQLAERASQVGGVPVGSDVAAIAPHWYAFTLQCENRGACKRASMKLAAQRDLFVELRRDTTRAGPSRPEHDIQ
jgi:hypothetical protein